MLFILFTKFVLFLWVPFSFNFHSVVLSVSQSVCLHSGFSCCCFVSCICVVILFFLVWSVNFSYRVHDSSPPLDIFTAWWLISQPVVWRPVFTIAMVVYGVDQTVGADLSMLQAHYCGNTSPTWPDCVLLFCTLCSFCLGVGSFGAVYPLEDDFIIHSQLALLFGCASIRYLSGMGWGIWTAKYSPAKPRPLCLLLLLVVV